MLESINGNEVTFKNMNDQRLRGEIIIKNTAKNNQIVFKMKSTNPRLFEAEPIKDLIPPGKTITIAITTTEPLSDSQIKQLSQKNKFMIEYILLQKKVVNMNQALQYLHGPAVQSIKIYINAGSIKNSKLLKPPKEQSVANSNKFSFHSMAVRTEQMGRDTQNYPSGDKLEKLKAQVDFLEKKRIELIKNAGNQFKKNKGGSLKLVIFFVLGLIAGNFGGKAVNLPNSIQSVTKKQPQPEPEQDGFFSIFNFGDEQQQAKKVQEQKAWWQIL